MRLRSLAAASRLHTPILLSVDAASGWRSNAAEPQHSGPFPGGGRPDPATKGQVPWNHPTCRSSCSAALGQRGPLLRCTFAESLHPCGGSGRGHVWHVLLRISPILRLCRPAKSSPYTSYGTGLPHPSLRWAEARLPEGQAGLQPGVPRPASPVPSTWMGLTAFSRKLPEWGKKPLTTRCAVTTIVLAVLVCLFTGSYQL